MYLDYFLSPLLRFLAIGLLFFQPCAAQDIPAGVKRILFLGNSITHRGTYVNDIETYFVTKYPDRKLIFINAGVPSETVSGLSEPGHADGAFPRPDLHERLGRVLSITKPDMIFACYGMNDGIYMPLDQERFGKFKEGINWLHKESVSKGIPIIHISPPHYDEMKGKSIGYEKVLETYADWLMKQHNAQGWKVIDIFHPMKRYLDAHRKVDAKFSIDGFALAGDGVHPGEAGHWIMAKQILLYLGCKDISATSGMQDMLKNIPDGAQLFKLVSTRQNMMRDAWLTATKHLRPGLAEGLPLPEAERAAAEISRQIDALLQKATEINTIKKP